MIISHLSVFPIQKALTSNLALRTKAFSSALFSYKKILFKKKRKKKEKALFNDINTPNIFFLVQESYPERLKVCHCSFQFRSEMDPGSLGPVPQQISVEWAAHGCPVAILGSWAVISSSAKLLPHQRRFKRNRPQRPMPTLMGQLWRPGLFFTTLCLQGLRQSRPECSAKI